jgi:hypothetical protein
MRDQIAAAELLDQCGLLVNDEAHCASDWSFDFRPDYQRLTRTLLARILVWIVRVRPSSSGARFGGRPPVFWLGFVKICRPSGQQISRN